MMDCYLLFLVRDGLLPSLSVTTPCRFIHGSTKKLWQWAKHRKPSSEKCRFINGVHSDWQNEGTYQPVPRPDGHMAPQ
ncbi:hypothetical protein O6P43_002071 [Quillaja saponaria]|uniref:Uncharacterized protein n=1 Tax=Quillaja saponaria TaxID=32244 RepID=A0AAD7VJT8_QUISA|nr:hypothetical protein O6P43_002071 [Quillaja saponaria]